ncbi:Double-stranded RNA-binding protein Staufen like protein 2 [Myotis davidii]|uniref:Double-stranded RNA-binding protein Staufen homolog 2 n=1 Tax=Myotis davidii TaxID=225400 RepID=L5LLZ6_MYODS|nr:Double-stranded RNA-binding protein Staufen like protein 2 [Myotis davidii]
MTLNEKSVQNSITQWIVDMEGAPGTLYEGEKFQLLFKFSSRYPFDSPQVMFTGENIPVHPHVYSNGHICLSILTEDWSPALSVQSVCLSIISMLSSCKEKRRPPDNSFYVRTCNKNPKKTKWWYHGRVGVFRMLPIVICLPSVAVLRTASTSSDTSCEVVVSMFSVQLSLGEQTWESEGSSIKKAQQAVASKALTESTLPKPVQKPPKSNVNNNPGSITPTVELNGLAMKRGEPAIYRPLDPKPFPNYRANYNFRGMYNQRYHCPMPKIFYVQLTVGNNEFFGEGKTRQAARHNAAMKALQALQNEPIPEKSSQNGESGKEMDDDKDANKSEISLVFEIALKRNMPVSFEVIKESGPPHMKSFVTRVSVGEFSAEGEGNSKKLSKKRAATTVLQELKKLPPLPVVEKPKLFFKKRPKTIVKAGPEYGQGMNPISRLAQIQQAKKEKEPDYVLLSERGIPRRREFVMQVKVGNEVATGTGPNKKIAKKNAAEAMLLQLGYKASTSLQDQLDKTGENKGWSGPKAGFPEPTNNTPKGILHLSPDVYQEMEASRHKVISGNTLGYLSPKDMNQPSSSFFSISPTSNSSATIARELLMNGTSPTAEAIGLKGSPPTPPCSAVQPSKQLEYLARIQGFQV